MLLPLGKKELLECIDENRNALDTFMKCIKIYASDSKLLNSDDIMHISSCYYESLCSSVEHLSESNMASASKKLDDAKDFLSDIDDIVIFGEGKLSDGDLCKIEGLQIKLILVIEDIQSELEFYLK